MSRRNSSSKASSKTPEKFNVALLTNIISPYRVPLYEAIAKAFDFHVIVSGTEDNRQWGDPTKGAEVAFRVVRARGVTLKRRAIGEQGIFEDKYFHINPGYLLDLFVLKPDAVITVEMGFRSIAAMIYGFVRRRPVWIWWGGTLHTERGISRVKRLLRARFARSTCRWISYGQTSTEYLTSIGVDSSRILQIQNCVDERLFTPDGPVYPLDLPRPRLLVVGRMVEGKGIFPLIDAVAALRGEGREFSLVVVGDGPERERFLARAEQTGVPVHHIAWVEPAVMPSVYRSCDLLVFPSLQDVWGLVVNEAMLCGLPVVSSVYAGATQELVPRENRFDPLDMESFVSTLRRALDGAISPPDPSNLRPLEDVARMIVTDIQASLNCPAKRSTQGWPPRGWTGRTSSRS